MSNAVIRRLGAAAVSATLLAGAFSADAQEMSLLMRAARIHPGQTRAEALAIIGMTPKSVENRRVAGILDWEALRFESGPTEVNVCLMFNRVISVGQIVHPGLIDQEPR